MLISVFVTCKLCCFFKPNFSLNITPKGPKMSPNTTLSLHLAQCLLSAKSYDSDKKVNNMRSTESVYHLQKVKTKKITTVKKVWTLGLNQHSFFYFSVNSLVFVSIY